jgi:hypothetical protein
MLAVGGEQVVAGFQRRHQPDHRGLLTEVEVAVPADPGLRVHLGGAQLESPDQGHLPVVAAQHFRWLAARRGVAGRSRFRRTRLAGHDMTPLGAGDPPAG